MSLYLDASVLTALILFEPRTATVRQRISDPAIEIIVSDLAIGETSAAIAAAARAQRLRPNQLQIAFASLDRWRTSDTRGEFTSSTDIARATAWVRDPQLRLRLPDAIHLAMADRFGATLLTADAAQADAAAMLSLRVDQIA